MVAWIAMGLWPFLSILFFRVLTPALALSVTIIGGYLFLPTHTEIDLPILPVIDKYSLPSFMAVILTIFAVHRTREKFLPGWLPKSPVVLLLILVLVAGSVGSALTNMDSVMSGGQLLPGMGVYDGLSLALTEITLLIPLFLGRKILATEEAQKTFLEVMVGFAIVYAFLALYEVRMSPQLNVMLYGFFPHSFLQHIRGGGFRPIVFLNHGLMVNLFFVFTLFAAVGLARFNTGKKRVVLYLVAIFLFVTMLLSKSLGAVMIAAALLPFFYMPHRLQRMAVIAVALIALIYPVLRMADLLPLEEIATFAERVSEDRANSLRFRIDQEEALLARAFERPVFGWGGWGRNFVYDEEGRNLSVPDGLWIIEFGIGGWVRYLALFGLLTWGILGTMFRKHPLSPVSATMMLILAANLIEILPNAGMTPLTWLLVGALIGRMELARHGAPAKTIPELTINTPPGKPVYRRDFETSSKSRHPLDSGRPLHRKIHL